jgi:hypothetical protein
VTAIMNRPDVPKILPGKHAQQPLRSRLAAGLRHVDRPWSMAIDAFLLLAVFGVMAFEGWEFARDLEWEHAAAAITAALIFALHGMRAFTSPDRSETDR